MHGFPTLRFGSFGFPVKVLQSALNVLESAHAELTVDGQYGPRTLKRVQEFQGEAKLARDGIVGPLTWAALSLAVELAGYAIDKINGLTPKPGAAPPAGGGTSTGWTAGMGPDEIAFRTRFLEVCRVESAARHGIKMSMPRIQQYMQASSVAPYTPGKTEEDTRFAMTGRSWCSDYVYFCLKQAKHFNLPVRHDNHRSVDTHGSIRRYMVAYAQTKTPKPGDLYIMEKVKVGGDAVWHIGVFWNWGTDDDLDAPPGAWFRSLDGNSGNPPITALCQEPIRVGSYHNAINRREKSLVTAFLSIWS